MRNVLMCLFLWTFGAGLASAESAESLQDDARWLLDQLEADYAYWADVPGGIGQVRTERGSEIGAIEITADLIDFGERVFHSLQDSHAITGSANGNSWALVPSYADLWIEVYGESYDITDVREGSPAAEAGLRPGCRLTGVGNQSIADAVAAFDPSDPGHLSEARRAYIARVLAAGRRDRDRQLRVTCEGFERSVSLPTLYAAPIQRPAETVSVERFRKGGRDIAVVRFNDRLGDLATVQALDEALPASGGVDALVLDFRDTASGGNTDVARGILSILIEERRPYQRHVLPAIERRTGIARSWLEEVSPRGERLQVDIAVLCGRWTGSMGEGLTIALDAFGVATFGSEMAGLKGGLRTVTLPNSGLQMKYPGEQLTHLNGQPREDFVPSRAFSFADAPDRKGRDSVLEAALEYLVSERASGVVPFTEAKFEREGVEALSEVDGR